MRIRENCHRTKRAYRPRISLGKTPCLDTGVCVYAFFFSTSAHASCGCTPAKMTSLPPLLSLHRCPFLAFSHLHYPTPKTGNSRLTNNILSMNSSCSESPDKYHKSATDISSTTASSWTLNDTSIEIEGGGGSVHSAHARHKADRGRDSIMGNFLTKDLRHANMQRNKWAPPPFEWETCEQESKPCSWAAEKAGKWS
jgi:hypothetical protein